ncbi:hypothetical protein [Duncaniella muris]|uniref:hypothetical protein n=1 Tax=Duncaniella muris TaxID=2094150 RepID=UPI003F67CDB8
MLKIFGRLFAYHIVAIGRERSEREEERGAGLAYLFDQQEIERTLGYSFRLDIANV